MPAQTRTLKEENSDSSIRELQPENLEPVFNGASRVPKRVREAWLISIDNRSFNAYSKVPTTRLCESYRPAAERRAILCPG